MRRKNGFIPVTGREEASDSSIFFGAIGGATFTFAGVGTAD